MRRFFPIAVYVAAVLAGQLSVNSQEPEARPIPVPELVPDVTDAPPVKLPERPYGSYPVEGPSENFNGFSVHRLSPDLGAPGGPSHGFFHFMMPMDKYTSWYRPKAATLTSGQRCAPDPFRPRGFGHLFARPCDDHRMEYAPYVLSDGSSQYGPSYIAHQPDPQCDDCDPTVRHGRHRGNCRNCD